MSILNQIQKGAKKRPHLIGLYGPGGVGKSTFAASAPKPIFLGTDDGLGMIDAASFPIPKTWAEVKAAIHALTTESHEYETLVIDTVNGLEPLLWAHIIKEARVSSIEEVDGGFGKGYVRAAEEWVVFFQTLKTLRNKMNVICLGHSKIKAFDDPYEGERFDKHIIKMNEQASALWIEAMDCMFFATYEIKTSKEKGAKKARAFGDGRRIMFTEERPAFAAKSRFALPFKMDLSWEAFAAATETAKPVVSEDEMAVIFKGIEPQALAYLISIRWLTEGQQLTDLKATYRKQVAAKRDAFLAAVKDFSNPTAEAAEPTTEATDGN